MTPCGRTFIISFMKAGLLTHISPDDIKYIHPIRRMKFGIVLSDYCKTSVSCDNRVCMW